MRVNNLQSLTNTFFSVVLSGSMIAAPAVSMQGCDFVRQHHIMSYSPEQDPDVARENLRMFFADLYDTSFYAKKLDKKGFPETDPRKSGLPMVLWRKPGVPLPNSGIVVLSNNVRAEQMEQVRDVVRDVKSYYDFLKEHAHEKIYRDAIEYMGIETFEKGLEIYTKFRDAYHGAVSAGIVIIHPVSAPSASR